MDDIYCFEKYGEYTVVVERLSNGVYEGIAYKYDHRNPEFVLETPSGEECLLCLKQIVDDKEPL